MPIRITCSIVVFVVIVIRSIGHGKATEQTNAIAKDGDLFKMTGECAEDGGQVLLVQSQATVSATGVHQPTNGRRRIALHHGIAGMPCHDGRYRGNAIGVYYDLSTRVVFDEPGE